MSLLNEDDVFINAEQAMIDKIVVQIRKEIEEKLSLKANVQDLWHTNGRTLEAEKDIKSLTDELHELQAKVWTMEETLSKCIKLDVPVTALDDTNGVIIKAYGDNRN